MQQTLTELNQLAQLLEQANGDGNGAQPIPDADKLLEKLQGGVVWWQDLELDEAFSAIGLNSSQIDALIAADPQDRTPVLQRVIDELSRATLEDVLTGVYNRRYFERSLAAELERSRRDQRPCGLVLLDIDHFKSFNDQHGHEVGDLVLKSVAHEIRQALRSTDTLSRVGGEEFAIIVPNTFQLDAGFLAERVRKNVEVLCIIHQGIPLRVTISIGVAINDPREAILLDELYRRADEALYQAKHGGRNCVRFNVSQSEQASSAVTVDERNELLG